MSFKSMRHDSTFTRASYIAEFLFVKLFTIKLGRNQKIIHTEMF